MHVLIPGAHGVIGGELSRLLLSDGLPLHGAGAPTPLRTWTAHRRSQQRYIDSARYTLQVDYREHARSLQRDLVA